MEQSVLSQFPDEDNRMGHLLVHNIYTHSVVLEATSTLLYTVKFTVGYIYCSLR